MTPSAALPGGPDSFSDTPQSTLANRLAQSRQWSSESIPRKLFWRSVPRLNLPIVIALYFLRPSFFRIDFLLLQRIAGAKSEASVTDHINDFFFHVPAFNQGLKGWLRLRVSGKRLLRISARAFAYPPS